MPKVGHLPPKRSFPGPFGFPGGTGLAEVGTPEHALMILVLLEVAALVFIRRTFKTAHGG